MKKVFALFIGVICVFMLVGCGTGEVKKETAVYTFCGENEYIIISNGTAVLDGEQETFSAGKLKLLEENISDDAVVWDEEFYIVRDGEERTVMKNAVNDMAGGASVSISGDLGKISGVNVITEYKNYDVEDFEKNLFFRLTVTDSRGKEKVYELKLDVEKVY